VVETERLAERHEEKCAKRAADILAQTAKLARPYTPVPYTRPLFGLTWVLLAGHILWFAGFND
jgi:hypothetical protein